MLQTRNVVKQTKTFACWPLWSNSTGNAHNSFIVKINRHSVCLYVRVEVSTHVWIVFPCFIICLYVSVILENRGIEGKIRVKRKCSFQITNWKISEFLGLYMCIVNLIKICSYLCKINVHVCLSVQLFVIGRIDYFCLFSIFNFEYLLFILFQCIHSWQLLAAMSTANCFKQRTN